MLDVVYLLMCAFFGAWTLGRVGEDPDSWLRAGLLTGIGAMLAATIAWGHVFVMMRLLAWGLFVACPAWALCAAWVVRSEGTKTPPVVLVGSALLLMALGVDAWLVEPRDLQLTTYTVASSEVTTPVRLVLITDIQTEDPGPYELEALKLAMAQAPDALLFAGDYIQISGDLDAHKAGLDRLNALMHEAGIDAPLGGWAVQGNTDVWPHYARAFRGLPIDARQTTRTAQKGELTITALSFEDGFDTELVLRSQPGFHVALAHGPDFALGQIDADLLVAGHTHGGQVRIPLLNWPPVTFSAIPRAWASGRTELPSGSTLIVSRGIGMERQGAPPIRLACRPEIVVIDVVPVSP